MALAQATGDYPNVGRSCSTLLLYEEPAAQPVEDNASMAGDQLSSDRQQSSCVGEDEQISFFPGARPAAFDWGCTCFGAHKTSGVHQATAPDGIGSVVTPIWKVFGGVCLPS